MPPKVTNEETKLLLKYMHNTSQGMDQDMALYKLWQEVKENLSELEADNFWQNRLSERDKERIEDVYKIFGEPPNLLHRREEIDKEATEEAAAESSGVGSSEVNLEEGGEASRDNEKGISGWFKNKFSKLANYFKGFSDYRPLENGERSNSESEDDQTQIPGEIMTHLEGLYIEKAVELISKKRIKDGGIKKFNNKEEAIEELKRSLDTSRPNDADERMFVYLEVIYNIMEIEKFGDYDSIEKFQGLIGDIEASKKSKLDEAIYLRKMCETHMRESINKNLLSKIQGTGIAIDQLSEEQKEKLQVLEEKNDSIYTYEDIRDNRIHCQKLIENAKEALAKDEFSQEAEESLKNTIREYEQKIVKSKRAEELQQLWKYDIENSKVYFDGSEELFREWDELCESDTASLPQIDLVGEDQTYYDNSEE